MKNNYMHFKMMLLFTGIIYFFNLSAFCQSKTENKPVYNSSWESLSNYSAPEWYEDAKLGFWVHWGIYSVPAYSGDHAAEWYGRWMYSLDGQSEGNRGLATHKHHVTTYGYPSVFGYKDFIPMFTAKKFDARKWAELFTEGGAKYFCMMGVHHDNFAMWNSKLTRFDAMDMGPKRDLVGEIEKAVRAKGLKFGVSNHSGWNYNFFAFNHINNYDAKDTTYQDLYGNPIINGTSVRPSERDLNRWLDRTIELCDNYKPDLYYFDWDINDAAFETRRTAFAAHYYNKGVDWKKGDFKRPGVVLNYKQEGFRAGTAVLDHERWSESTIPSMVWQTDDCVYSGENWGYVANAPVKSPNTIIDELVDIVSKRGVLMLSFAPRPDGTFPDDQIKLMRSLGDWLKICGEAIYSTRPWILYGEGPTTLDNKKKTYSSEDIRFTRNKANTTLYAILLDKPDGDITIKSLNKSRVNKNEIKDITLIGSKDKLKWSQDENGLTIKMSTVKPAYDYAFPIKITFKYNLPKVAGKI